MEHRRLAGQFVEFIGVPGHRGDDDGDLIAARDNCGDPRRDGADPRDIAKRGAAKLLDKKRQCGIR